VWDEALDSRLAFHCLGGISCVGRRVVIAFVALDFAIGMNPSCGVKTWMTLSHPLHSLPRTSIVLTIDFENCSYLFKVKPSVVSR
jgi:hypothetical protein